MGDPKFSSRSYNTPSHPWQGERIKEEAGIVKRYGLKNKRELWKAKTIVHNLRKQSRDLQARLRTGEEQAKKETVALLRKCARMGLLPMEGATLDDVLGLGTEIMLGRRLQTVVVSKGLATTPGQARQFIVHGHISIEDRRVTIPGYIVNRGEEDRIVLNPLSPIADEMHPVRVAQQVAREAGPKREVVETRRDDYRNPKKRFVKKLDKNTVKADTGVTAPVPIELPPEEGKQ
jgi:small subunit ribosomal protein S4